MMADSYPYREVRSFPGLLVSWAEFASIVQDALVAAGDLPLQLFEVQGEDEAVADQAEQLAR
ncbi:MAG: hypothetical protein ACNA8R_14575, partial [Nitriliruptoraceae bacterium]